MSKERNEYLEMDGLYFESETHEWFKDKGNTQYAHKKTPGQSKDDGLTNLFFFVVRNKETGEYDRVVLDFEQDNQPIYDTKNLEDLAFWIDKQKLTKRFNDGNS